VIARQRRRVPGGACASSLGAGRPLDRSSRARFEGRFGHDLRDVRLHDDERAGFTARALGTRAYTSGAHVVFADPAGARDARLVAHELAHVVQQERIGSAGDPEIGARRAEHGAVSPAELGSAPPGVYAQDDEERPVTVEPAISLPWDVLLRPGAFQLTPPFADTGPTSRFGFGVRPLTPPTLGPLPSLTPPPGLSPGALTPPGAAPSPLAAPSPAPTAAPAAAGSPPSRLSVASSGSFSFGLRLGFPEPEARAIPGAPPAALSESLRRAQLMNAVLTGKVPQGWEAIDKAQLARAVWGIFSTHLAPDVAGRITRSLAAKGPAGTSYQLDLVLLTNFTGGGVSFSVQY
jgi:hypothetical protein